MHRVVVVGGGFGGLRVVRRLKSAPVEVTLVDQHNFHLFQPLLYQVATGALSPANIASPLRSLLRHQRNAQVLLAKVVDLDAAAHRLIFSDGEISYDTLVIAAGASYSYFGHDDWRSMAPGLKSIEDATEIRSRVLSAFESAERETDPAKVHDLLTFMIVGGGPTGVELAGALAEIARHTLKHDFRHINPGDATILLVEGGDRILPTFPPKLSEDAVRSLARLGVHVRTNCIVKEIAPHVVTLAGKDRTETVRTGVILWAAGVQAAPLSRAIATATGASLDRIGRLVVEPDLTLPGHSELFVIGDMANCSHQTGQPLPGVAPVAIQQGHYVADLIRARLAGTSSPPFEYRDKGSLATIGRRAAVVDFGWLQTGGLVAWILWLFIHLLLLARFENRVLVLIQWAWNYLTFGRAARLITVPPPQDEAPANPHDA